MRHRTPSSASAAATKPSAGRNGRRYDRFRETGIPFSGRLLAAIRKNRGLTQSQLTMAVGKTRQMVGHLETGRVGDIGVGALSRIADALGCRSRDLLAPPDAPILPRLFVLVHLAPQTINHHHERNSAPAA
jgi:transcriptional regulator with XRE-family HTH domain